MYKSLDNYEWLPRAMRDYLAFYGYHFSKAAYEYACKSMYARNASGKEEKVTPYTKEQVDKLLEKHGVQLDNKVLYDYVYVATWGKAHVLGSSVPDESRLALFIKNVIDDDDTSNETVFRRFLAQHAGNGEPIDFEELIEDD